MEELRGAGAERAMVLSIQHSSSVNVTVNVLSAAAPERLSTCAFAANEPFSSPSNIASDSKATPAMTVAAIASVPVASLTLLRSSDERIVGCRTSAGGFEERGLIARRCMVATRAADRGTWPPALPFPKK